MVWTRMSAVACERSQRWKVGKTPVTINVLKITTPQTVIQSMAISPVRAPYRNDLPARSTGVCQTVIARPTVTAAPMIVATQAVTRKTARTTSSTISGTSAISAVRARLLAGSRTW
jgi:hypothetical protein